MGQNQPEQSPLAIFTNAVRIRFSPGEFYMDFGQGRGSPVATMVGSFVMNPVQAKDLLRALNEAVQQYEVQHGVILGDDRRVVVPVPLHKMPTS